MVMEQFERKLAKIKKEDNKRRYGRLFTKTGKPTGTLRNMPLPNEKGVIRPIKWRWNGIRHKLEDRSDVVHFVLTRAGYGYKDGNDAPRGGQDGYYMKVSKQAAAFIDWLREK